MNTISSLQWNEVEVRLFDQGVLDALREVPVLGWLGTMVDAKRSDLSEGERLVLQQRELNNRLQHVRQGITELPGCRPEPVTAGRLTDLLEEFWTGEPTQYAGEIPTSQCYHEIPIIQRDTERTIDDEDTLHSRGRL